MFRSVVSTVRSLVWIRTLSLAHCSSSWCWKRFHVDSILIRHGNFLALMTWYSLRTPRVSVSPSSMHGRLAWKLKGPMLLWKIPNSPVLSVVVVSATTPSHICSASCGSTNGTVASLNHWWQTQTISGEKARQWQNCDWSGHFQLPTRWYAELQWGLWESCCHQMLRGLGKVKETIPVLPDPFHQRYAARCMWLCSTLGKRGDQIRLYHNDHAMVHWIWGTTGTNKTPSTSLLQKIGTEDIRAVFPSQWLIYWEQVQLSGLILGLRPANERPCNGGVELLMWPPWPEHRVYVPAMRSGAGQRNLKILSCGLIPNARTCSLVRLQLWHT